MLIARKVPTGEKNYHPLYLFYNVEATPFELRNALQNVFERHKARVGNNFNLGLAQILSSFLDRIEDIFYLLAMEIRRMIGKRFQINVISLENEEYYVRDSPIVVLTINDVKDSLDVINRYIREYIQKSKHLLELLAIYTPVTDEEFLETEKLLKEAEKKGRLMRMEVLLNQLYHIAMSLLEEKYLKGSWRFKYNDIPAIASGTTAGVLSLIGLVFLFDYIYDYVQWNQYAFAFISAIIIGLLSGSLIGYLSGARDILRKNVLLAVLCISLFLFHKYGTIYSQFLESLGWSSGLAFLFTLFLMGTGFFFLYLFGYFSSLYIEKRTFRGFPGSFYFKEKEEFG